MQLGRWSPSWLKPSPYALCAGDDDDDGLDAQMRRQIEAANAARAAEAAERAGRRDDDDDDNDDGGDGSECLNMLIQRSS